MNEIFEVSIESRTKHFECGPYNSYTKAYEKVKLELGDDLIMDSQYKDYWFFKNDSMYTHATIICRKVL